MSAIDIRTVNVVQYLQPLREGGSLPGLVKGDDDFLYVIKFRGAGHGERALISEFIGGELAKALGLRIPELVFLNLDDSFRQTEPDEEIQDLLKFSVGLNLGMSFLSDALTYDPVAHETDALTASKVVLLDSIISNIDRTVKNTNLLMWHKELWVIDNGASFYFHHNWPTWEDHLQRTFPLVKDHVLLPLATQLPQAAKAVQALLTADKVKEIVDWLPEEWLIDNGHGMNPEQMKAAYTAFVMSRINKVEELVKEAQNAR